MDSDLILYPYPSGRQLAHSAYQCVPIFCEERPLDLRIQNRIPPISALPQPIVKQLYMTHRNPPLSLKKYKNTSQSILSNPYLSNNMSTTNGNLNPLTIPYTTEKKLPSFSILLQHLSQRKVHRSNVKDNKVNLAEVHIFKIPNQRPKKSTQSKKRVRVPTPGKYYPPCPETQVVYKPTDIVPPQVQRIDPNDLPGPSRMH